MYNYALNLRAAFIVLVGLVGLVGTAHADDVCSESHRCLLTVGSPGRYASIASHRMLFASGELVWPSILDVHVLDLATGRTRTLPHCGTTIGDIALEGGSVYILADHAMLCRVSLTNPHVQMLVNAPNTVVEGFGVSSVAVALSMRRRGEQPELRVVQFSNGQIHDFPTAVTAEHIVVDATSAYWLDAGVLVRASITTGAKTVGPRVLDHVTRMQVDHGVVYVATDHQVLRLDSAGTSFVVIAREGADDLAVDGHDVYWTSTQRGTITKLQATNAAAIPTRIGTTAKPFALALDAASLFVAADDPFVIKQVVPR